MKQNINATQMTYTKKIIMTLATAALVFASATVSASDNNKKKQNNMKTIELTKADFLAKVADFENNPTQWIYKGDKPAIVDFYAPWCGPCKMVAPILEELAAEYDGQIVIYKVNTMNEQELAADFGIRSIPSLLFIPMNGKPQMAQGAMGKEDFKRIIDSVLLGK